MGTVRTSKRIISVPSLGSVTSRSDPSWRAEHDPPAGVPTHLGCQRHPPSHEPHWPRPLRQRGVDSCRHRHRSVRRPQQVDGAEEVISSRSADSASAGWPRTSSGAVSTGCKGVGPATGAGGEPRGGDIESVGRDRHRFTAELLSSVGDDRLGVSSTTARQLPRSSDTNAVSRMCPLCHSATGAGADRHPAPVSARSRRSVRRRGRRDVLSRTAPTSAPNVPRAASTANAPCPGARTIRAMPRRSAMASVRPSLSSPASANGGVRSPSLLAGGCPFPRIGTSSRSGRAPQLRRPPQTRSPAVEPSGRSSSGADEHVEADLRSAAQRVEPSGWATGRSFREWTAMSALPWGFLRHERRRRLG